MTAEQLRLDETREPKIPWRKWGPYLGERQWGTVREDYSENGDAWNFFTCEGDVPLLFTENETNHERLFPGHKNESPYVKDGINNCVVHGDQGAVNPGKQGTKVAAHYQVHISAGHTQVIRLRLSKASPDRKGKPFGKQFDEVFADRSREADEFYKSVTPPSVSEDAANVMRQAIAAFSIAYADQRERDHGMLMEAVRAGKLEVLVEEAV